MISVIIVNWNTADLLAACLTSLQSSHFEALDVIVVDNASDDDSVMRASGLGARVIALDENVGFARANNHGWRATHGESDVIVLLNSDTRAAPGAIEALARWLRARPSFAAVGPRLALPDGEAQPFAFGCDPKPGYMMRRAWQRLRGRPMHDWADTREREVDWVSGACLAVRREALANIDGLDEGFFMYFEDVDLCARLRKSGWKIGLAPQAVVTHIGGQSLRLNPAARAAYGESLKRYYHKHFGLIAQLWLTLTLPIYQRFLT